MKRQVFMQHPLIDSTRLLGSIIPSDLRWEQSTNHVVKKAMPIWNYSDGLQVLDRKFMIWKTYVRNKLEQNWIVWHSFLTEQNKNDLEHVYRSALKIILGEGYESYSKALNTLNLETLEERTEHLCLIFPGDVPRMRKIK